MATDKIKESLRENIRVKELLLQDEYLEQIAEIAQEMAAALRRGNKVLLFGNGGSAADAQHIAAELMGRFGMERPSLPAIALTANTSTITAIGNDYGYESIFSRQVEGIGKRGDVVIGISTSGKSKNVLRGIESAKQMGIRTAALTGAGGGPLAQAADLALIVPSKNTQRIQETHITVGHILCELVEQELYDSRKDQIANRATSSYR